MSSDVKTFRELAERLGEAVTNVTGQMLNTVADAVGNLAEKSDFGDPNVNELVYRHLMMLKDGIADALRESVERVFHLLHEAANLYLESKEAWNASLDSTLNGILSEFEARLDALSDQNSQLFTSLAGISASKADELRAGIERLLDHLRQEFRQTLIALRTTNKALSVSDFGDSYEQVHDFRHCSFPNIYEMTQPYTVVLDTIPHIFLLPSDWTPRNLHPSETVRWVEEGRTYVTLTPDSRLTIEKGYRWDGPGNFGIDLTGVWPDMMRGSLVHDALYDLMRLGLLDKGPPVREDTDRVMALIFIEDGVSFPIAICGHTAVSVGGYWAARQTMPAWKTGNIHGYSYSARWADSMDTSSGSEYHR